MSAFEATSRFSRLSLSSKPRCTQHHLGQGRRGVVGTVIARWLPVDARVSETQDGENIEFWSGHAKYAKDPPYIRRNTGSSEPLVNDKHSMPLPPVQTHHDRCRSKTSGGTKEHPAIHIEYMAHECFTPRHWVWKTDQTSD